MNELSTKSLLAQADEHNRGLENNYILLALDLVQIEDTDAWKDEYDSFADYYSEHLGREKSTVSRLLKAGRYIIEHGLPTGNVKSYRRLAQAITAHPDETPEKVLAIANSLSLSDFRDEKKDECLHLKPSVKVCPDCWKRTEV